MGVFQPLNQSYRSLAWTTSTRLSKVEAQQAQMVIDIYTIKTGMSKIHSTLQEMFNFLKSSAPTTTTTTTTTTTPPLVDATVEGEEILGSAPEPQQDKQLKLVSQYADSPEPIPNTILHR